MHPDLAKSDPQTLESWRQSYVLSGNNKTVDIVANLRVFFSFPLKCKLFTNYFLSTQGQLRSLSRGF